MLSIEWHDLRLPRISHSLLQQPPRLVVYNKKIASFTSSNLCISGILFLILLIHPLDGIPLYVVVHVHVLYGRGDFGVAHELL